MLSMLLGKVDKRWVRYHSYFQRHNLEQGRLVMQREKLSYYTLSANIWTELDEY